MNELIRVEETTINNQIVPIVNARDLYEKLEIGREFATWIKDRIEKY
jgi:phage anti-repressor protein